MATRNNWLVASDGEAFDARKDSNVSWTSKLPLCKGENVIGGKCSWIIVDFQRSTVITAIQTMGNDNGSFITGYKVGFSSNCEDFKFTSDDEGNITVFRGNTKSDETSTNVLEEVIVARCIQIVPTGYTNKPSLRFELLGCGKLENKLNYFM